MTANVFVLDEEREWFLEEGRIDPMTRAPYKRGDRVVVCRSCKMVSLESTWNDCGGCTAPGCRCKTTARRFLKMPPPKIDERSKTLNKIVLRNGKVERQNDSENKTSQADGTPKMVITARHFYN